MTIAMSWPLQPDGDGHAWGPPAPPSRLVRALGGWRYQREGQDPGPLLPDDAVTGARWQLRLGSGPVVARLEPTILLVPGGHLDLWFGLPLTMVLTLREGGPVLDELAPDLRRTVLGAVDRGLVLPCANAVPLEGPEDPALPATWYAVRVRARNTGAEAAVLRRVPVQEPRLSLWRKGDRVAAGTVGVTLAGDQSAEARLVAAEPPAGFERVGEPGGALEEMAFSWLHDAARHRVEFQP